MKGNVKRLLCLILTLAMGFPSGITLSFAADEVQVQSSEIPVYENKDYVVRFDAPAEDSIEGWKNASLPIGNGYMGVNIFGGVGYDRLLVTEQSMFTSSSSYVSSRYSAGQESFADVYIDTAHTVDAATNYSRILRLNDGVANLSYTYDGVDYTREYFSSYPDKVTVVKLTASGEGNLNFTLRPTISYERDSFPEATYIDESGKRGTVVAEGDTITMEGHSDYYSIDFEAQFKVVADGGEMTAENGTDDEGNTDNGTITVSGANSAYIYFAVGTNYELTSSTFTAARADKISGNAHPHEKVTGYMTDASAYSYDELKARHSADVLSYFNRNVFDIGGADDGRTTAELITSYKAGTQEKYLEELYYQMGRYMMIASSREGTLPPGLQGIWNAYLIAPWTAGFWYNVNQQMNYWPIFSTNLGDLYKAYSDFNLARLPQAEANGSTYIKKYRADQYEEGNNGWIVGTGNSAYTVGGVSAGGHSGPGTGGFTAVSDIDYFRFTNDTETLSAVYPIIESLARFYSKCVDNYDGLYLATISASPENLHNGKAYQALGCAFDQQMIYETNKAVIDIYDEYKDILENPDTELIEKLRAQVDYYDHVIIGLSGQVKEYREEDYYGDIGEYTHRHISQLVGLYPGTSINDETPAWVDGAKVTLRERGLDTGTGWSVAHKLGMWARTDDGETSYSLVQGLINKHLFDNLWNCHDTRTASNLSTCVFQAEGNFGGTAGIAEMLLQSHGEYIKVLPAVPSAWADGSFKGMVARGNFAVSADWTDGIASGIEVISNAGGTLKLNYYNIANATVTKNGETVTFASSDKDHIEIETVAGDVVVVTDIPTYTVTADVADVAADEAGNDATVTWTASSDEGVVYNVYRAIESEPTYELMTTTTDTSYTDATREGRQATYKITAVSSGSEESLGGTSTVIPTAGAVEEITAFMADDSNLQLQWVIPENAYSFKIYEKTEDGYSLLLETEDTICIIENASADKTYAISAVFYDTESEIKDITIGEIGDSVSKLELYNYIAEVKALYNEGFTDEDLATIEADIAAVEAVWYDTAATAEEVAEAVSLAKEILETSSYFVKNVALGKTVTMGSGITVNSSYPASNITDGDDTTRMATNGGAKAELVFEVDLEEAYTISSFTLIDFRDGNGSRGDKVAVEGLLSNGKWITMATAGDEIIDYTYASSKRTIDMASTISLPVSALRVTMTDTDSFRKDMSIWEFKAIGALPDSRPVISNLAFNAAKPATGSILLAENIDNGDYFYSDRDTFTMAHLGSALKGKTQIRLPVNDSTRAKNDELSAFLEGDNTYFSFNANSDGKIYVAFTKALPNLTEERGWSLVSSSAPALPDGITDIKNLEYTYEFTENPYYATKFQWSSNANINTVAANISYADRRGVVYEKSFSAYETVEVPTIGLSTNENYFVVVDLNGENTNSELDYIFYGDQMVKAESGKYDYEFEVDPETETVDLSALAKSSTATVELSTETLTFTNGLATATVKVTSGENVSEYTLTFKKLTNVALNKAITVDPTSLAQAGSYGSFSNEAIVDGSFDSASGRYYSGAKSNIVAEIDLGAVYDIEYMNVSEFRGNAPMRTDNLMVEAYHDGAWTTVLTGEALDGELTGTAYSTTRFDFSERVRAKKLRLTFKNSGYDNGETDSDSDGAYDTAGTSVKDISIVEVEAYGVYVESGMNPSSELSAIYVGGEALADFSSDTHEYTVYTKEDSVEIYGEAVSYDAAVSDKITVDMSSGRAVANIVVTGATGEVSTYVVNVIKTTNVALNKSVTATPAESQGYVAANIVDGDFETRYYGGSGAYCPVVEIDLGGEYTITDFVVAEFRYPADFPMRINNLMIYAYTGGEYKLIKSGVALDGEVSGTSSRTYITLDEPVSGVSKLKFDLQNLGRVNGETATNSMTVGSQTTYIYDISGTSKRDCSVCEIQAFGVSESECIEAYPASDTYDKTVLSDDNAETYYEAAVDFSAETAYAVFDTSAYTDIETILVTPRSYSDGEEYYFDRPVGYTVYTSDDNLTFTRVKSGEITYDDFNDFDTKTITLDSAVNAKYVKLEITSVYGARADKKTYFALSEVGFGVAGETIVEPLDGMQFYNIRDGFSNSYIKFNEKETATVAFLGGSITSASGYRVNLMNYLEEKFPDTTFTFINAGIPSTDSTMGAFRLDKDILSKGEVDLLFVEFAVNDEDNARSETESIKGMEGIIRHAYEANPYMDIMVMHFSDPTKHSQYSATEEHTMPVIDAQEKAVSHYSVTSLDLAKEVSARIANGEFTWEEFGGKHPSAAGHKIYSDAVVAVLENSWESAASEKAVKALPEKLNENSYIAGRYEDISGAVLTNGFTYVESWAPTDSVSTRDGFVNVPMLESTSTDASLTYTFTGTDLGILLPAGPDVGYITYSLDGGEEQTRNLFTNWSKSLHIPWVYMLATELEYGEHTITINASETTDSRSTGNAVRIQSFLVNGEILEVTSPIERDLHQRNDENQATFTISGNTTADSVEISAVRMEGYSAGADMAAVTTDVIGGKFEKDITLSGGYYKVTVKAIKDGEVIATEEIEKIGVGEIFITAGQSNSASFSQDETSASDDRVSSYDYANGKWVFAEDPQVSLGDANEFTSWGNGDGETRSGGSVWPSLGDILTAELDVPVGFINIGIGSSVVSSWNGSLYSRMQRAVTAFGVNGVRAVLWHQGENDSRAGTTTENYKSALVSVIEKSRTDAGWDIPWVVSIAAYHSNEESTAENQEMIREAQRAVIAETPSVYEGPYTDDMLGDLRDSTKVHFSLAGLKEFATRWWVSLENAFFMGEYPVSVISGEDITAYINGGKAQNWGTLKTESYLMGTEFTLAVEDNGTNKFMYWQDALSGKIISYSKEYSFVLGSVKNIRAVFANSKSGALITFKGMGDVVYASAYNSVTVPENPYLMGYEFIGWYDELTQTDLGIKAGESFTSDANLSVKAGWKTDDTMYSVEVVGANEQSADYKYNSKVSLTAKETDENGNAFSYWMRDGNVVSYEKNYSFYVSSATKVEAVYGESAQAEVIIAMANPVLVEGTKIAFFAERLVPEEYTVIETGILMSDAANVSLANCDYKAIAKSVSNKGQYTVRKKGVLVGETWYGAAYVIYRDGDGTVYTAYSNEVSYTLK